MNFGHIQDEYWEHAEYLIQKSDISDDVTVSSKKFGNYHNKFCFEVSSSETNFRLKIGYFIGADWVLENQRSIVVFPKLNSRIESILDKDCEDIEFDDTPGTMVDRGKDVFVDYFAMLNQCLSEDYLYNEIDNLVLIDWKATPIPIKQEKDFLSPLIIVKYLNVLKAIIRKGLKKSYFQTTQNLNSRIKGKILVGPNIKRNVVKNRFLNTLCQFDEFGIDSMENRLLKKAFQFASAYLDASKKLFPSSGNHLNNILNYCRPALEFINEEVNIDDVKSYKANPFFKEYDEAIHLAKLILKRFSYNISNATTDNFTTPPYWIDMPKLFELYAYHFLKQKYSGTKEVNYHLSTYGNELDFLIDSNGIKMIVDAKYKPMYIYGKNHQDIRQVSGYARLEKIYDSLNIENDQLIDCLIIYPDIENGLDLKSFDLAKKSPIGGYRNIYKIGIKLPVKN